MATTKHEQRVYSMSQLQLFGICLTALGQLRATIGQHDVERGTITALFGNRRGATSDLTLALRPLGDARTELTATWQARKRSGDQRLLAVFLEAVDGLAV